MFAISVWEGEPPVGPLFVNSGDEAVFTVNNIKHNNAAHQEVRPHNILIALPISGSPSQYLDRPPNFGFALTIS
jgi:hypothetical protein